MADRPFSLPDLLVAEDFAGNWATYVEALWSRFRQDFLLSQPRLGGMPVRVDRQLGAHGKETQFWHLVEKGEEGGIEEDRQPDFRRCERLPWIRYLIESVGTSQVEMWIDRSRKGTRAKLALSDFSYIVVLKKTSDHYRLITAYPVETSHQRERLRRECGRLRGSET